MSSPQQKWDTAVSEFKEIGKNVLGIFKPNHRNKDQFLADLRNNNKKIHGDIESCAASHLLTNKLRETRREISSRLREVEEDKMNEKHCVKGVRIWSFSGQRFPTVGLNTEIYRVNLRKSPYSVRMRENAVQ